MFSKDMRIAMKMLQGPIVPTFDCHIYIILEINAHDRDELGLIEGREAPTYHSHACHAAPCRGGIGRCEHTVLS